MLSSVGVVRRGVEGDAGEPIAPGLAMGLENTEEVGENCRSLQTLFERIMSKFVPTAPKESSCGSRSFSAVPPAVEAFEMTDVDDGDLGLLLVNNPFSAETAEFCLTDGVGDAALLRECDRESVEGGDKLLPSSWLLSNGFVNDDC